MYKPLPGYPHNTSPNSTSKSFLKPSNQNNDCVFLNQNKHWPVLSAKAGTFSGIHTDVLGARLLPSWSFRINREFKLKAVKAQTSFLKAQRYEVRYHVHVSVHF